MRKAVRGHPTAATPAQSVRAGSDQKEIPRMTQVWPGSAYPLGATYDGTGTNFAIFSEVAEKVELCLFDDDGNEERIRLPEMDGYVWHAFLPGIHPGQKYGFRVYGPYDPSQGLR